MSIAGFVKSSLVGSVKSPIRSRSVLVASVLTSAGSPKKIQVIGERQSHVALRGGEIGTDGTVASIRGRFDFHRRAEVDVIAVLDGSLGIDQLVVSGNIDAAAFVKQVGVVEVNVDRPTLLRDLDGAVVFVLLDIQRLRNDRNDAGT